MLKNTLCFLLIIFMAGLSACKSTSKNAGCAANQICTEQFVSLGVQFVDKAGNRVSIKDITVTNQRTNKTVVLKNVVDPGFSLDYRIIATDDNKSDFSTTGDDVKVTATNAADNKTVSALYKISGGCNCHVVKLSGPDKIVFE